MGKTTVPNLVESDTKAKAKSSKGAPKARKVRGRTINRRRERAMRKALKAIEKKAMAPEDATAEIAKLHDQIQILKEAHARNVARMTSKK